MDHLSGVRKQMKSSLNKPEGSILQATALKEDFNLPEICWKSRMQSTSSPDFWKVSEITWYWHCMGHQGEMHS